LTDKILSPAPPDRSKPLRRPKVAIIGAGITGVTSAAHCVGHGFDVTIFEAGGEDNLGGIWSVSAPSNTGVNADCDRPLTAFRGSTTPRVSRSTR
jgi:glycine/D-amino acid oxidase-like deaminating enzyme